MRVLAVIEKRWWLSFALHRFKCYLVEFLQCDLNMGGRSCIEPLSFRLTT